MDDKVDEEMSDPKKVKDSSVQTENDGVKHWRMCKTIWASNTLPAPSIKQTL